MKLLINITIFLLSLSMLSQNSISSELSSLDKIIRSDMELANAPGAAIRVTRDKVTILDRHFGIRNAKSKAPVDSNTLFLTASVTKTVTTTAMLILCQRNNIPVETKIGDILKDLPEQLSKLTIHQILSQSSGVLDHMPTNKKRKNDPRAYFSHYGDKLLCKEIQGVFSYTNIGHVLAGMIVSELNESTFENAIQGLLFHPLQMDRSTYSVDDEKWKNHAAAHKNGKVVRHAYAFPLMKASASLFSTAEDLSHFAECFMNNGDFRGEQVIPPKVIELMTKEYTTVGILHNYFGYQGSAYGYGLMSFEYKGVDFKGHPGETTSQNLLFAMIPDQQISIIIMSNAGFFPFIKTFEYLAENISTNQDHLQKNESQNPGAIDKTEPNIDLRTQVQIYKEYLGDYYEPEISGSKETDLEIFSQRNELYIRVSNSETYETYELKNLSPDRFSYESSNLKFPLEIRFYRDANDQVSHLNHYWKTAVKK